MLNDISVDVSAKTPIDLRIDVTDNVLKLAGIIVVSALIWRVKK